MGAIVSRMARSIELHEVSLGETRKRQRTYPSFYEANPRLIPSLPDEISIQILARLPRSCYLGVKLVSRSWKASILSSELYEVRKELGTTEEWLYILTKVKDDKLMWSALDPLSMKWQRLPLMPNVALEEGSRRGLSSLWMCNILGSSIRIADAIRGWLGRKVALDRMPFCGCAVGAVDGCIYVFGGFAKASAMSSVWCYHPILNRWSEVSPMSIGRAYCKAGVLNNKLYVVGGVTMGPEGLTPLRTAEVFDPCTGLWSEVPSMPFSKAQVLPTVFLTDFLKPIATGMTSYRGKLYVPQSLYCWPFFVDVGGEVYDPETNSWVEMPIGMGDGWPAKQAGTKPSVIVDGELYALDPSSSSHSAKIKLYDDEDDTWKVVEGDVPIHDFDSESPYLVTGLLGKLHVITKDANHNIAVMQAERQNYSSSFPSTSTALLDAWRVIATRSAGSEELVSCQILDI
ncbi:Galactose oxidase/kelch repeat superfamily protein [Actinidia rufa]|uniref:Galactose oxidase/kelch repeat superfamily protein n=1 Tax=Actinidia rufa TaxID=165716 RepID=A0A7J0EUA0_9ERIC|nr:Galactose oxidase/kelch repeat superfamily protein [Actinidia rufa]